MEKLNAKTFFQRDEAVIQKMKDAYLACPAAVKYISGLKLTDQQIDDNIDKIYEFVRDINYCKACPGAENCIKTNPMLVCKVVYNDGFVERQLSPCKRLLEKMEFESQFIVRDFEKEWLNSTLKKLDKTTSRGEAIIKYKHYIDGDSNDWIYLNGGEHSGRSYLAATLAVDFAKKDKGLVAFINASNRFRQLSDIAYKDQETFQKQLDKYCSVALLVIDDFGSERVNDFTRDSILYPILASRSSNKLLTIFTSDFEIDEIVDLYSTTKSGTIRAQQIGRLLKGNVKDETNLGEISVY